MGIAHLQSVVALCMLYKIRCKLIHPLYGALHVPYVSVRVIYGDLIPHRYAYEPPRCRTSQYRMTFILLSVSLWNYLDEPVFDGVGLAGSKSWAKHFFIGLSCSIHFCLLLFFPFSFFCLLIGIVGLESWMTGIFPSHALPTYFNNNNNSHMPMKSTYLGITCPSKPLIWVSHVHADHLYGYHIPKQTAYLGITCPCRQPI